MMVLAGVALASQSAHDEYGYRRSKSSERDECLVALDQRAWVTSASAKIC